MHRTLDFRLAGSCFPYAGPWILAVETYQGKWHVDQWFGGLCVRIGCRVTRCGVILGRHRPQRVPPCRRQWHATLQSPRFGSLRTSEESVVVSGAAAADVDAVPWR